MLNFIFPFKIQNLLLVVADVLHQLYFKVHIVEPANFLFIILKFRFILFDSTFCDFYLLIDICLRIWNSFWWSWQKVLVKSIAHFFKFPTQLSIFPVQLFDSPVARFFTKGLWTLNNSTCWVRILFLSNNWRLLLVIRFELILINVLLSLSGVGIWRSWKVIIRNVILWSFFLDVFHFNSTVLKVSYLEIKFGSFHHIHRLILFDEPYTIQL